MKNDIYVLENTKTQKGIMKDYIKQYVMELQWLGRNTDQGQSKESISRDG